MKKKTRYLKPLEAWVTDLTDRYRYNPFVQATVHIIVIQVLLGVVLLSVTRWAIEYEEITTVNSIRHHIEVTGHAGLANAGGVVSHAIYTIQDNTLMIVFIGTLLLIIIFSYLLNRFALAPAKNSLHFQKRFIGNIAHELRTPLSIIKTATEVSLMNPSLAPDVRETFQDTIHELDRISEIINNLLSFDTLFRPGKMKTELVNIDAVAAQVVKAYGAYARARGVSLSLDSKEHDHIILGNRTGIEEVLTNLVKNAVTYTPAHTQGCVTVNVYFENPETVSVEIEDTGIGIDQKDVMHIFEPFYRGDTSRARGVGTGTSGLGLAIVHEIVRLHRGETTVRSTPGVGTIIKITFPVPKNLPES